MRNRKTPINEIIANLAANRMFRRFFMLGLVMAVAIVLLLISAPWNTSLPEPTATPDPSVSETSTPDVYDTPPVETPMVDDPSINSSDTLPTPPPTPPPVDSLFANPLTGESWHEDVSSKRPFAVAIGNTTDAMPQLGIGKADIILEYVVEGTTRIMALYQDVSYVGAIGGIRSFRSSSYEISAGFDAIFVHWIGREYNGDEIPGNPVTRRGSIDASWGSLGYRYRGKVSPHNAVTSGERLTENLPSSYRTEHESGYDQSMAFKADGTPANGQTANSVDVRFYTDEKLTYFNYDANSGKYNVRQYGKDVTDYESRERLSFTNLIVLKTEVRPYGNEHGHRYIKSVGEGTGYYINGGKYIEITWSRPELTSPYSFSLTDGTPLEMGVGKTYICIIKDTLEPSFS
ncbi:MAG: DUF3048 domain-containing protein [Oscillospiraceae bacterium]|nr:DUF3048 domain-containing protein [Oscillospiraceae bacterium]